MYTVLDTLGTPSHSSQCWIHWENSVAGYTVNIMRVDTLRIPSDRTHCWVHWEHHETIHSAGYTGYTMRQYTVLDTLGTPWDSTQCWIHWEHHETVHSAGYTGNTMRQYTVLDTLGTQWDSTQCWIHWVHHETIHSAGYTGYTMRLKLDIILKEFQMNEVPNYVLITNCLEGISFAQQCLVLERAWP